METVFSTNHPDPFELEKAKKMLKVSLNLQIYLSFPPCPSLNVCSLFALQDHEQALIDAIAKLAYASDGESGNKKKYVQIIISCSFVLYIIQNSYSKVLPTYQMMFIDSDIFLYA